MEKLSVKLAMEMRGGRRGEVEERERRKMVRRKVFMLMSDKVKDASLDADLAYVQFCKSKKEMWKVIPWASRVGWQVRELMRGEMGFEWHERMSLMQSSVNHLINKHKMLRKEEVPAEWRRSLCEVCAFSGMLRSVVTARTSWAWCWLTSTTSC